jgi:NDP-sugar pyrophosphorylase family protein
MVSIVTLNEGVPNQGALKVEQGIITEFQEDGTTRILERSEHFFRASSTGCYFVQRSLLLSNLFQFGTSLEKEILPSLVDRRLVGAVSCGQGLFLDYGTPERYALLRDNPWMLEKTYGFQK